MDKLTENAIKQATLRFLKTHYRHRPRSGETELSSDMRGAGGIIADGFLSFPKEDGSRFIATFEATSFDTMEEVRYRLRRDLLRWDATSGALLITALLVGLSNIARVLTVWETGPWLNAILIVSLIVTTAVILEVFLRYARRYRYIYAIEQFRQYHADEQWVSIGQDVFSGYKDSYYRELRRQCIYNGIGLIEIDHKRRAHLRITPTRQPLPGDTREIISFVSLDELNQRMKDGFKADWLKQFNKVRNNRFLIPGKHITILPFKKRFFHQIILAVFSLSFISGLFIEELGNPPVRYVDEQEFAEEVQAKTRAGDPEPVTYLIDTPFVRPFLKKVTPYLRMEVMEARPEEVADRGEKAEIMVFSEADSVIFYDCARFYTKNAKYIIQEEEYPDLELALVRMWEINDAAKDMDAACLWLKCFWKDSRGYVIYFGSLFDSFSAANEELIKYQQALSKALPGVKLKIRSLPPGVE